MSVYTCKLQPIGLQLSDKYVHYYYGYCILLTPETYSRPTDSDVRGITQVSVIHLRNPQFQDGRRSSPWTMQTPCLRPIENQHFHWFNMTQSCKHDTIPQCIWKPCRHHPYRRPMCNWGILVIFGGHLGFGIKMTPPPPLSPTHKNRNIISTPEKDSSP